jgi:hypothetical protein
MHPASRRCVLLHQRHMQESLASYASITFKLF